MFDWKLLKRVSPPMVLLMIRWLVALKCFGFDELEDVQGLTYIYIQQFTQLGMILLVDPYLQVIWFPRSSLPVDAFTKFLQDRSNRNVGRLVIEQFAVENCPFIDIYFHDSPVILMVLFQFANSEKFPKSTVSLIDIMVSMDSLFPKSSWYLWIRWNLIACTS